MDTNFEISKKCYLVGEKYLGQIPRESKEIEKKMRMSSWIALVLSCVGFPLFCFSYCRPGVLRKGQEISKGQAEEFRHGDKGCRP